jgi:LuxR family maltose regulon positive regulatory protein
VRRPHGPAFDLFTAKLRRPQLPLGVVRRSLLIDWLASGDPCPIMSVVAPLGYGKTTLLWQWATLVAARLGSAFAAMTSPVVLVLDDAHVLRNAQCRAAVAALANHVPPGASSSAVGPRGANPGGVPVSRAVSAST